MTDEQRVKEVWPDARVICGPENCNGHQIVVPIGVDGWGAEFGAWADAASRLPKATADHEFVWHADSEQCSVCGENHHGCIIVKQPSAPSAKEGEPAPQTFEEWWAKRIIVDDIYNSYRNACRLAWNAAKVSSPVVAGGEGEKVLDAAIIRVLEQRCERGTDWDKAVLACADALRRLKHGERAEHETQPLIKDVRGKE